MRIEVWIALMSLSGVLVGSLITFMGNLIQKRIERNSQIHKLISEKRFEAHESLIASVRWCQISLGEIKNERFVKYSQIFMSAKDYDNWYVGFNLVQNRFSHLWDKRLDEKLHIFKTYLANLNNLLNELRDENGEFINQELINNIGEILHNDILSLSRSVLREASRFYSTEIYWSKFKPSTSFYDDDEDGSTYFIEVSKMLLYTERPKIRALINSTLEN